MGAINPEFVSQTQVRVPYSIHVLAEGSLGLALTLQVALLQVALFFLLGVKRLQRAVRAPVEFASLPKHGFAWA